ncbi:DUF4156 domain-containing protein [Fangia hongkongensis]|uniref:DUF4156 domain-containing protein n=1 Tax=Fangia hongkongensis TaxID=270495 RepID=UPI0003823B7F|nr:DUF4156 domain-containing protein [Fangia hongkongensis]MBK2124609.1 DUF4156 domain-containing protein [Fangia hongkongensis]
MKIYHFGSLALISLLAGCSAIQLSPEAQRILATPNKPEGHCKYLGSVTGHQGNFFTGSWTSNANMEEGAMNDLKNKALKLGANYIQLVTNRAANTMSGSFSDNGGSISSEQTSVVQVGNAYYCPSLDETKEA